MDQETLIKRLMATFLDELEEHVVALNRDLLALEKDQTGEGRAERLKTLFRTAHSLKGAARSVNVSLLESACHCLEEILTAVRDAKMPLGPELFVLLFAVADAIEEAGMRLREQHDLTGTPLAALLPRLEAASRKDEGGRIPGKDEGGRMKDEPKPSLPDSALRKDEGARLKEEPAPILPASS